MSIQAVMECSILVWVGEFPSFEVPGSSVVRASVSGTCISSAVYVSVTFDHFSLKTISSLFCFISYSARHDN